jgi:tRNA(Ile)-lysidine synthase
MHPLEKEILAFIREDSLVDAGEKIVIGVSAGPDSMSLLHVLASLRAELDVELVAVYVDHGLRPDETPLEEELVVQQTKKLGMGFRIGKVDVREESSKRKISLEHSARDLRYGFLGKVAKEMGASKIAVAHTADDQAEEVLLRLIRGTGRAGLSGMKPMRDGKVIRPFLNTSKENLLSYLCDKKIPSLEDSSNRDTVYLRNRIRLEVIPFLSEINPNISEVLRQTASVLQDEEVILVQKTEQAWEGGVATFCESSCPGSLPAISISLYDFLSLKRGIQRRIIEKVFVEMSSQPQFKKIASVLSVAATGETGAQLHFSKGLRMKKGKDHLLFSYPQGAISRRGNL